MRKDKTVKFLNNYEKYRNAIRDLILGNVNISVREGERELWNCNTGEWKDKKFQHFKVVQEFNVETFLADLLPLLNKISEILEK
jgi:hypothetical protein